MSWSILWLKYDSGQVCRLRTETEMYEVRYCSLVPLQPWLEKAPNHGESQCQRRNIARYLPADNGIKIAAISTTSRPNNPAQ